MMQDVQIDLAEIANSTAEELGAQIGRLTGELNAQRAVNKALFERLAEMEKTGTDSIDQAKTG